MNEIYEKPSIVAEYLLFHYGADDEILPTDVKWPSGMKEALNFAARTPGNFTKKNAKRGLDLGCAVGRSTFEMAQRCEEVVGMDYSQAFIDAAEALRKGGALPYLRRDEGHLQTELMARASADFSPDAVRFFQGDAMHLPKDLGQFDLVHAANLLCRLRKPSMLLERLPDLVARGGELVLATPCTWLEEFTPSKEWPTGSTLDWLQMSLGENFSLTKTCDEPFLIRETSRKFQWTRSLVSVWQRL